MTRRLLPGVAGRPSAPARARGFTLVELLVAMTLGLFVIGGLVMAYVSNQRMRAELERDSRQIENGRYAVQVLADDLRHAGFLGEFDPAAMATPGALPDVCETDIGTLRTALPLSVQGADDLGAEAACTPGLAAGTDVVVVRRASTCVAGAVGCSAVEPGEAYFQASLCNSPAELGSLSVTDRFALSDATASFTRTQRDCTTRAVLRRFLVRVYYVASENEAGDGIPTLKRAELRAGQWVVEPLVEGVQNLQVEYGVDDDGDGVPDQYGTDPGVLGGCAGTACVENWRNVVTAKLHLLARNTEQSPGHTDTKTYVLGLTSAGGDNTVGPFEDRFRRHAYSTLVRLNNMAGRRE